MISFIISTFQVEVKIVLFPLVLQDLVADYSCACAPGYTGKNCSIDIEECLAADCPENSTCIEDAPGSFVCSCHPGFEGEDCTGRYAE